MYERFFGFRRRPFCATPNPHCFVPLPVFEDALGRLRVAVESGQGVAVVTGAAGTGKTLLCTALIERMDQRFQTVFLPNSHFANRSTLLQTLLFELGRPYRRMEEQELWLELTDTLRQARSARGTVVLVVDEAHLLDVDRLEDVRNITNVVDHGQPLVRVVLSGQFPLEERLAEPALEALGQRICCHVHLENLGREESEEYVRQCVAWAGARPEDVFDDEAVPLIAHVSDGLPRCLNQLCDHSLLLGYVNERRPVDAEVVLEALEDVKQLPLKWNDPPAVSGDEPVSLSEPVPTETGAPAPSGKSAGDVYDLASDEGGLSAVEVGFSNADEAADVEPWEPSPPPPASEPWAPDFAPASEPGPATEEPSSAKPSWEEEYVLDRYARLDAGLAGDLDRPIEEEAPLPAVEAAESSDVTADRSDTWLVGDATQTDELDDATGVVEVGGPADADDATDDVTPIDEPSAFVVPEEDDSTDRTTAENPPAGRRPDRTIDELLPLLNDALGSLGATTADEAASAAPEPSPAEEAALAEPAEEASVDELEEAIGHEVAETCATARSAVNESLERRLERRMAAGSGGEDESVSQNEPANDTDDWPSAERADYDVVEPDDAGGYGNDSGSCDTPGTGGTGRERTGVRRDYRRLFNELRHS